MRHAFLSLLVFLLSARSLRAAVWDVGEGQVIQRVSDIAQTLNAGDVVRLHGTTNDCFTISTSGTHAEPIVIRGIDTNGTGRGRAAVRLDRAAQTHGIVVEGNWVLLENLDISGAPGPPLCSTGISVKGSNVTIRNCRVHHNLQGLSSSGDIDGLCVEFCEFDSNGCVDNMRHSVYVSSQRPGGTMAFRYCWFHDATGGMLLKSRFPIGRIENNYFENAFTSCVQAVADIYSASGLSKVSECHTDIIGNVFVQGHSPYGRYAVLQLGGEHETCPGTEGEFNIAHNLFVTTRSGDSYDSLPAVALVHGNVDRISAYNNAFLEWGTAGSKAYERGTVWPELEASKRFARRRGHADPDVQGSNNWTTPRTLGVPEAFVKTLRGMNPKFVDALNGDFRPRQDSPLAGAGVWPLPQGRTGVLMPEFEPQRGIPADLKPKLRRKVEKPAIGPFEVEE